jgi:hypothetical protein
MTSRNQYRSSACESRFFLYAAGIGDWTRVMIVCPILVSQI